MSKGRRLRKISEHRTEKEAIEGLIEASRVIVREGKTDAFLLKIESTGDQFIPWAVYLHERQ